MADLIDRQWLMERLGIKDDCRECQYSLGPLCSKWSELVDACEAISDAPSVQPEPRWIPVTERLPEPPSFCLVTTDGSHNDVIDIALFMSDGWHKASTILAWMPLPKAYKEDSDG